MMRAMIVDFETEVDLKETLGPIYVREKSFWLHRSLKRVLTGVFVRFPNGRWVHLLTGDVYDGGQSHRSISAT